MVAWAPLCIMLSTETCPQWGGVPSEPLNEAVYAWELLRSKENHLLGRFSELIRHVNYYIWTCAWLRGIVGSLLRLEKKKIDPRYFFFSGTPLICTLIRVIGTQYGSFSHPSFTVRDSAMLTNMFIICPCIISASASQTCWVYCVYLTGSPSMVENSLQVLSEVSLSLNPPSQQISNQNYMI
jgi:hypothetical protein